MAWLYERLASAPSLLRQRVEEGSGVPYFNLVDVLRGCAALAVVLFHYGVFFATAPGALVNEDVLASLPSLPFYPLLQLFYRHGFWAVQFFWMISGFVFAGVYFVSKAKTLDFAVNRFARLYPLHLLTLLIVAALQFGSVNMWGGSTLWANNDPFHFVLQLLFASYWLVSFGHSFNGPIWSVSVEVLVYAIFWLSLPLLRRWPWASFPAAVFFGVLTMLETRGYFILQCATFFYSGICLYLLSLFRRTGWLAVPAGLLGLGLYEMVDALAGVFFMVFALVLAAVSLEKKWGHHAARLRWFGDCAYGIYLVHTPLVLIALIFAPLLGLSLPYLSPWFLIGYVGLVILLARLSFVYIEGPARRAIKKQWHVRRPGAPISI